MQLNICSYVNNIREENKKKNEYCLHNYIYSTTWHSLICVVVMDYSLTGIHLYLYYILYLNISVHECISHFNPISSGFDRTSYMCYDGLWAAALALNCTTQNMSYIGIYGYTFYILSFIFIIITHIGTTQCMPFVKTDFRSKSNIQILIYTSQPQSYYEKKQYQCVIDAQCTGCFSY